MVEAGIDGDTVQPGVKGRGWRKAFEILKCLYESVLRGVIGIILVL